MLLHTHKGLSVIVDNLLLEPIDEDLLIEQLDVTGVLAYVRAHHMSPDADRFLKATIKDEHKPHVDLTIREHDTDGWRTLSVPLCGLYLADEKPTYDKEVVRLGEFVRDELKQLDLPLDPLEYRLELELDEDPYRNVVHKDIGTFADVRVKVRPKAMEPAPLIDLASKICEPVEAAGETLRKWYEFIRFSLGENEYRLHMECGPHEQLLIHTHALNALSRTKYMLSANSHKTMDLMPAIDFPASGDWELIDVQNRIFLSIVRDPKYNPHDRLYEMAREYFDSKGSPDRSELVQQYFYLPRVEVQKR